MRHTVKFLLLLLLTASAHAATTTVTGTVLDPSGAAYKNGNISAYTIGTDGPIPASGSPWPTNNSGAFSFTITSQDWYFKICTPAVAVVPPNPVAYGTVCFTAGPITISGGSQSISTQLNAAAPLINPSAVGQLPLNTPSIANQFFSAYNSTSGAFTQRAIVAGDVPTLNQNTTGTAALATAFDHTPTKCSAGNYPLGVDTGGNAQNCTVAGGGDNTATYMLGSADGTLTNSKVISGLFNGPQPTPASPSAFDCEFTTTVCSFSTWVAQGSSTTAILNDRLIFNNDGTTGGVASFVGEATPSPTYQFDMPMCLAPKSNSFYIVGLALEESGTGKIEWGGFYVGNGLTVGFGTSAAGINNVDSTDTALSVPSCWYIRVKVDSTNITWSTSFDGVLFRQQVVHAKTTHFTVAPDQIGIAFANYGQNAVSVDWIRRTL